MSIERITICTCDRCGNRMSPDRRDNPNPFRAPQQPQHPDPDDPEIPF